MYICVCIYISCSADVSTSDTCTEHLRSIITVGLYKIFVYL